MKLKNKLLPIVALSGIATIAIPLVVSCNNGGNIPGGQWDVEWDFKQGGYESDIEPLAEQPMTTKEATNKYFDDLAQNENIFCDDFVMSFNKTATREGTIINSGLLKVQASNLQKTNKTLSVKSYFDLDLSNAVGRNSIIKGTIDVETIPFEIIKDVNEDAAVSTELINDSVQTIDDLLNILAACEGWRIASDILIKKPSVDVGITIKVDFSDANKPTTDDDLVNIKTLLGQFGFASNYLQNITLSE